MSRLNQCIGRAWCMPNKNTFKIKPIKDLLTKHVDKSLVVIDPFANENNEFATITNDLDPTFGTDYNMDALEFLKTFDDASVDIVLFDPPYSPRQVSESYKKLGMSVNKETTQSSFWSNMKNEVARITKSGSKVISFGWNSQGIGKTRGFTIVEILLVAHGGHHNDTICTVEVKR